jgi:fumarylacetoacetate (FAA) hydrolase family protein
MTPPSRLSASECVPTDAAALLIGRAWVPAEDGPSVIAVRGDLAVGDLAPQAHSRYHQYPDGLLLFIGTMFAPVDDRGGPGSGFTHKTGDVVRIAASELGARWSTRW